MLYQQQSSLLLSEKQAMSGDKVLPLIILHQKYDKMGCFNQLNAPQLQTQFCISEQWYQVNR